MSFIEQTSRIFNSVAELKFQAALFGREAFYIEGARPIRIDKTEMIFKVSGALVHVTGENLAIKELDGDCAAITGKINGFTVNDL
ncbi:MAG: hypothetical protein HDT28_03090 [Clostridiales bacterium]|nr:hypothetical protein [Clostridiales bacterium]